MNTFWPGVMEDFDEMLVLYSDAQGETIAAQDSEVSAKELVKSLEDQEFKAAKAEDERRAAELEKAAKAIAD